MQPRRNSRTNEEEGRLVTRAANAGAAKKGVAALHGPLLHNTGEKTHRWSLYHMPPPLSSAGGHVLCLLEGAPYSAEAITAPWLRLKCLVNSKVPLQSIQGE